jgi:hypothetical protein
MVFSKKTFSRISSRFAGYLKIERDNLEQTEGCESIPLSRIQILPPELKLQILENAGDVLAVRNLLIACPSFHPVYCENRYKVLLNALRVGLGNITDVWALVVLNIHKIGGAGPLSRERAKQIWMMGERMTWVQDRNRFIDTKPSLSDLVQISKMHCWVVQECEKYSRKTSKPNIVSFRRCEVDKTQALYACFYYIETFAAIIGEKDRGWPAASLRTTRWEKSLLYLWDSYDIDMMSQIVKVIWPHRFWGTPSCRRRTRVLLVRDARPRRSEGISYD